MVYQKYSVANAVGTVIEGTVIDGKVIVGIDRPVMGVMDIGVNENGVTEIGVNEIGVNEIGVNEIGVNEIGVKEKGVIEIEGAAGGDTDAGAGCAPESNALQSRSAQQPCTPFKVTQKRPHHDLA